MKKEMLTVFILLLVLVFSGCSINVPYKLKGDMEFDPLMMRVKTIPVSTKTVYLGDFKEREIVKRPSTFTGSKLIIHFNIGQSMSQYLDKVSDFTFLQDLSNPMQTILEFELLRTNVEDFYMSGFGGHTLHMNYEIAIRWVLKDKNKQVIDSNEVVVSEKVKEFSTGSDFKEFPLNIAIKRIANEFIKQVTSSPKIYAFSERQNLPTVIAAKQKEFLMQKISPVEYSDNEKIGQKYAVVIGIGNYSNSAIGKLKYSAADAKAIYSFLTDSDGMAIPKDNVKLLLNSDATLVNIRSALGTFLARKALKNDLIFIYFAGHGAPEVDHERKEPDGYAKYILAYDTNPNDLYASALPMNEVSTIFNRLESNRLIFVADTCYSGSSGGRTFSMLDNLRSVTITEKFLDQMIQGEGRVVLTASDRNEPAMEIDDLGHGLFTYYFLEGLKGNADINGDGYVTLYETYDYLYDKVVKRSKKEGGNQHPIWKGNVRGQIVLKKLR